MRSSGSPLHNVRRRSSECLAKRTINPTATLFLIMRLGRSLSRPNPITSSSKERSNVVFLQDKIQLFKSRAICSEQHPIEPAEQ
jgi:hypothetical protein